ncbi:facilitated trehalose transporter Tret1-like [Leguminivora glycinivorella]|uniref:facilitated trehalose transporter Tret1-like n=1 Tax=Leguminivora glycinivorella TaxID=1035111 RepID=UPI00200E58AF|nr:facilitated trehalose transporter Tret1-like [Leguminivora glycinivorella]
MVKMTHKNRRIQYLAAFSVSLASMTLGISSAWPTPVLPKLKKGSFEITDAEIGWVVAMSSPGFIVGSLVTRYLADRFGRRASVLISACPTAVGTLVVAFATKAWLLYLTRFLWGVGTGMGSTLVPMYIGEISDSEVRATLSLFTRVMFNLGCLLVMSIGMFVSYECLNYMLLVLPGAYFVACLWIPESPYYLLKRGRVGEAKNALMRLRQQKDEKELEDEVARLQADVRNETRRSGSLKELLCGRQYRKAVIIGAGLKVTQIMTGSLAVQQYLSTILEESNIHMQVSTAVIVFGAVRFVVGIMSSILVDRVGRRPLLIYSLLGTGVSLGAVSTYFFLKDILKLSHESLSSYSFIPFAGIISSTILSNVGYNSIIFVIPAEIFPLNVKAVALSSLSTFGGVCGFTLAKGFQVIQNLAGFCAVFWVFAVVAFSGTIFTMLYVPETKGKSLKDIQVLLQGDLYYDEGCERLNEVTNTVKDDCGDEMQEIHPKDVKC